MDQKSCQNGHTLETFSVNEVTVISIRKINIQYFKLLMNVQYIIMPLSKA